MEKIMKAAAADLAQSKEVTFGTAMAAASHPRRP